MDSQTDRRTNGWSDMTSQRNMQLHLKTRKNKGIEEKKKNKEKKIDRKKENK